MAVTPQTNIKLLKVPLTIDNKNQITFANSSAQYNYFNSLQKLEIDECQYQRKDNIIRYPAHIDSIINYNYCMYQNENYGDKWFYAFIVNMSYINDGMTEIAISTDTFQTWQFDLIYKESFVEREHVSDDTIGLHTIDENLDVGDVIEEGEVIETSLGEYFWVAVETAWLPSGSSGGEQFSGITVYNKSVYGNKIILFKASTSQDLISLGLYILRTNGDGHIEDIKNIFIVPDGLINQATLTIHNCTVGNNNFSYYTFPNNFDVESFNITINKVTSFSEYTPKNNKCYSYPYNYLLVSNNIGNLNIFKYEDFYSQNSCTFKTILALSIGCSGKLIPLNHKKMSENYDESLPLAKYPTCSWSSDAFINWLTQNAVNEATNMSFGIFGMSNRYNSSVNSAMSTKDTKIQQNQISSSNISLGLDIAGTIANQIGNFYSGSLMPNIQGGNNVGDVTWSYGNNTFVFKKMRAKTEKLKIIDSYFSMYGYKVNALKIPNINNRQNWNYIKCTNINILGNIPQNDLEEIKSFFNSGITLWHNPITFLDYSQNNS